MTVEELLQRLVDLVREGKGKKEISTTFFDGLDYFATWPSIVEFNEHEDEVEIKAYEKKGEE